MKKELRTLIYKRFKDYNPINMEDSLRRTAIENFQKVWPEVLKEIEDAAKEFQKERELSNARQCQAKKEPIEYGKYLRKHQERVKEKEALERTKNAARINWETRMKEASAVEEAFNEHRWSAIKYNDWLITMERSAPEKRRGYRSVYKVIANRFKNNEAKKEFVVELGRKNITNSAWTSAIISVLRWIEQNHECDECNKMKPDCTPITGRNICKDCLYANAEQLLQYVKSSAEAKLLARVIAKKHK